MSQFYKDIDRLHEAVEPFRMGVMWNRAIDSVNEATIASMRLLGTLLVQSKVFDNFVDTLKANDSL